MKVAVVVSTLPQLTTNQLVGLDLVEEFERLGHQVDLYCVGRVDADEILRVYGKGLKARIQCSRWFWPPGTTIYDYPIQAAILRVPRGYDLVLEAIGGVIHLSKAETPQFTYVFYPPDPDLMGDGRFRFGFGRLYSLPYRLFYNRYKSNLGSTRVLAISEYIAGLCKKAWGATASVVYFPVPYGDWERGAGGQQRDGIISIGRFSSEKNQHEQLLLAKELADAGVKQSLRIVGATPNLASRALYWKLRRQAASLGLNQVHFYPNLGRAETITMANHSKVFLHTMKNEHFGIATVEAIAGGCVPIVHDSGGSREVVPIEELRFRAPEEAAERVTLALAGKFDFYLPILKERIRAFTEEAFKKRVSSIIFSADSSGARGS